MKNLLIGFLSIGLLQTHAQTRADWKQLFNGKDLKDWTVKIAGKPLGDNFGETFSVKNGLMAVNYNGYAAFDQQYGHVFYKEPFSYYKIRIEYRFVGQQCGGGEGWAERNSGVMLHCQKPETMGLKQDFPISIEVQFLGGKPDGKQRPTCNVCTPGTHVFMADTLQTNHCINSKSETYFGNQWVLAEIEVLGNEVIRHKVNGKEVLSYTKPHMGGGVVGGYLPEVKIDGQSLSGGYIALQSESHPIEFRKVELLNLEGCKNPQAKNYRSYFVKDAPNSCVF